jgi:hypothetical protein
MLEAALDDVHIIMLETALADVHIIMLEAPRATSI